jgi:cell wall-associated NlpC family hydrolase
MVAAMPGSPPFAADAKTSRHTPPAPPRRVGVGGGVLCGAAWALGWVLASASAQAAPDATGDGITRFLNERGLIETPAPTPGAGSEPAGFPAQFPAQWREKAGSASEWASDLVISAMNFLGVPYRRGGQSSEQGFDCSGFTRHVFEASIGLMLPRRSQEQAQAPGLRIVDRHELKPGDLVFFNTLRAAFSHVGIYVGDGKFIHSPRSGGEVRVEDMRQAYWTKRYNGARRAEPTARTSGAPAPLVQATALPPLAAPAALPATPPGMAGPTAPPGGL